jgi:hypothetical protein
MKLNKSMTLVGSLCMAVAFGGVANIAVAAEAKTAPADAAASQKISLLGDHLAFNVKGYVAQAVPGGGPGTMYVNKAEKRVMLIGEDAIPVVARGASDSDFINGMKSIKDKQKQASPDYKVISEKTENVKGLEVYHIEATDKMDGNNVQQATLLSAADNKFTVIQVISNAKDKTGHAAAVNNILAK